MRLVTLTFVVLVSLATVGCGNSTSSPDASDGKLRVVATTVQIGALVREVGADKIDLVILVGPGVDPHDYEATTDDLKAIKASSVVFANGLGLDSFLAKAINSAGGKDKVVTVTDGVKLRSAQGTESENDPHVWHNPENVKVMIDNIANALGKRDGANAAIYKANATAYNIVLDDTDRQIRSIIDSIPQANRKMVTNHDAFGYFIDRYGLTFVGAVIPGSSTQGETSPKDIANLTSLIRQEGVKVIFSENTVDPKVAREIAKDTGVRIIDDLYGDSLGEPGSGAETIHGMLLANAKRISEALK